MLRYVAFFVVSVLTATVVQADQRPADRIVAAHYPPLMIDHAPDQPGYAIDVLREAARRADRDLDLQFLPFERAIFEVLTSEATLMPALFKGKEHDDDLLWVAEIHRTALRFSAVGQKVDTLNDARALDGIVVERGTTSEHLLQKLGFDNVHRSSSPRASANMLASGRADAWLLTEEMMRQTWRQLEVTKPLSIGNEVHAIPVFLVASAGLPDATLRVYREAIDAMRADGTVDEIWQRYTSRTN